MDGARVAREDRVKRIALLGYPVEHSLSPGMHDAAFDALGLPYRYELLPVTEEEFGARVRECVAEGFAGWNVTIPHKGRMLPFLDWMSDEVRATEACNTVRVESGRLLGYNTDAAGFMAGLAEVGGIAPGSQAVLLGAGGAARAVAWALVRDGYDVTVLSRRQEQGEQLAQALESHLPRPIDHASLSPATLNRHLEGASLLVNCTPVGMWPNVSLTPLPVGLRLPTGLLVYDLTYRPRPTELLKRAAQMGCRIQDGLAMLINQGAAAFELWTGCAAPLAVMRRSVSGRTTETPRTQRT